MLVAADRINEESQGVSPLRAKNKTARSYLSEKEARMFSARRQGSLARLWWNREAFIVALVT